MRTKIWLLYLNWKPFYAPSNKRLLLRQTDLEGERGNTQKNFKIWKWKQMHSKRNTISTLRKFEYFRKRNIPNEQIFNWTIAAVNATDSWTCMHFIFPTLFASSSRIFVLSYRLWLVWYGKRDGLRLDNLMNMRPWLFFVSVSE